MYFKITNENENHNGYQYQDRLNVLDKPFEKEGSCVPGGLYYTTLEHIHKFYGYGVWIREVTIPDNAEMVLDPEGNKCRADKIILGKKYPLYDIETIKKFNLIVDTEFIGLASMLGQTDFLEYWLKHCKESGLEFKYTPWAIDCASEQGHIEVLEWWKQSGLKLKYNAEGFKHAFRNNHSKVLEWYYANKLVDGWTLNIL